MYFMDGPFAVINLDIRSVKCVVCDDSLCTQDLQETETESFDQLIIIDLIGCDGCWEIAVMEFRHLSRDSKAKRESILNGKDYLD